MTVVKARDKLVNKVTLYKKWRDIAEPKGWGVNPAEHHIEADESKGLQMIRHMLTSKCSFYYSFEKKTGEAPNIPSPFMVESGRPERYNVVQDDFSNGMNPEEYQHGKQGETVRKEERYCLIWMTINQIR